MVEKEKKCIYSVVKISDIINVIIPFFEKYTLQTKKRADFLLWKRAAMLKYNKRGIQEDLLKIKASMNRGLSKQLKKRFPLVEGVNRPKIKFNLPLNPYWVSGFVSGDGCFSVYILEKELKEYGNTRIRFNICQNEIDKELLEYMKIYFNCGNISKNNTIINYDVYSIIDIEKNIIPFFLKYPIRGEKYNNFIKWIKVFDLIKNKKHLTAEGFEKIKKIKGKMNSFNLK